MKLQKLFKYLLEGKKTSLQISKHVKSVCPSTIISDLRKRGCDIRGKRIGTSESGSPIWMYDLVSYPKSVFERYVEAI